MKTATLLTAATALLALVAPGLALADQASEQAAAELLEMRMQTERPEDLAMLKAVQGKQIVVVRGEMDHIEQVLAAANIRHTAIWPKQVADYDLTADHILMVNCPGNINQAGLRRIERFVRAGGLLYTTDWALANVVQRAFPGTIRHNGQSTGDHVTPVHVHRHDDNMMSGMLLRKEGKPQWWLEGGSFPIKILDPGRVEVLASSEQMKRRYGAAPVVVRFRWEDGEVIHVVSHFYRQARTTGPRVAAKKAIEDVGGLSAAQKAEFRAGAGGAVDMSEVESSYAFQQMTGNLIVNKQKRNAELDEAYNMQTTQSLSIDGRQAPAQSRVRVLRRAKGQVYLRDDRGNEAWVDQDAVEAR